MVLENMTRTRLLIIGLSGFDIRLAYLLKDLEEKILLVRVDSHQEPDLQELIEKISDHRERSTDADILAFAKALQLTHLDRPSFRSQKAPTRADHLQRQRLHSRRTGRK